MSKAENLQKVLAEIRQAAALAGRAPEEIKLIAVSKTKPASDVAELLRLGQRDFGENYVQEALEKMEALKAENPIWHYIGTLQSNKAKFIPGRFSLFHALDSENLAAKLDKAAAAAGLVQDCLLEVNVDHEATKGGLLPDDLDYILENISALANLNIRGLMCIPAPSKSPRKPFARLRELLDYVNKNSCYRHPLTELSMGMSADFADAILEGATMVRVGSRIFGERG